MMKILLVLSLLFPTILFGQVMLTGVVLDRKSKHPVEYATVYINGSTHGVVTDADGYFELAYVNLPCLLVVSHVSYSTKSIEVAATNPEQLAVSLSPKKVDLAEVEIEDENLRYANLMHFTGKFLGTDYWGVNAKLTNDEVLTFSYEYYPRKVMFTKHNKGGLKRYYKHKDVEWSEDGTCLIAQRKSIFKASASEPLIVDLPLLGYTVHVNMVDFNVYYQMNNMITFLSYYYFKPYEVVTEQQIKNRKKVYYNSSQHFCRSLFSNELKQNGFVLMEKCANDTIDSDQGGNVVDNILSGLLSPGAEKFTYHHLDGSLPIASVGVNEKQVVGLKDKNYVIQYYHNSDGSPRDLRSEEAWSIFSQSIVSFRSDTCLVRRNGLVPNSLILFGGKISDKQVGALLPDDYLVADDMPHITNYAK